MPNHFLRVTHKDGSHSMQLIDTSVQPIAIPEPAKVTLGDTKKFTCSLCGKKYGTPGVASIHFAKQHKEQYVDKDTWRSFMNKE